QEEKGTEAYCQEARSEEGSRQARCQEARCQEGAEESCQESSSQGTEACSQEESRSSRSCREEGLKLDALKKPRLGGVFLCPQDGALGTHQVPDCFSRNRSVSTGRRLTELSADGYFSPSAVGRTPAFRYASRRREGDGFDKGNRVAGG